MRKRPISLTSLTPFLTGAAVWVYATAAYAGPIVNDFPTRSSVETPLAPGYQPRDAFYDRHSSEIETQSLSLGTEQAAALLVLFLPWAESNPVPLPPEKGSGNTGGETDGGKTGGDGNGTKGGDGGKGKDPGDPGGGSGPTVHSSPEPASLFSGALGAGLVALLGWRRRRQTMKP